MRFYIADCHFYHEALNTKMDKRGFASAEQMNEYMIQRWNEKVRSCDETVILGDFSFGNAMQTNSLLKQLNGKKYLIEGNHDWGARVWQMPAGTGLKKILSKYI